MKMLIAPMLLAGSLFAGLSVSQPFPSTTLEDQFEKRHTVNEKDKLVIVSYERDVSDAVNAYLKKQPKGFLADRNAKYIADISAMPTIISTLFALPKMRDYSYPIMLNYDGGFGKKFDKKEGKLTVYRLEDGKVVSIDFVDGKTVGTVFAD